MRARTFSGLRLGWLTSFPARQPFSVPSPLMRFFPGGCGPSTGAQDRRRFGPGAVRTRGHQPFVARRKIACAKCAALSKPSCTSKACTPPKPSRRWERSRSFSPRACANMFGRPKSPSDRTRKRSPWSRCRARRRQRLSPPRPPLVLKTTLLFAQEQPMLDVALVEIPGGSRLLVLSDGSRRHLSSARNEPFRKCAQWDLETSLPITHSRTFPRDLRGRLLLRRDHLFDVYLPGTFCRSSSNAPRRSRSPVMTLTIRGLSRPTTPACAPFLPPRAISSPERSLPASEKSPMFRLSIRRRRFRDPGYTLWAFAAVDGSLHLVDGITDQVIRGAKWGSDLAAVHSGCGAGTQLLFRRAARSRARRSARI